MPGKTKTQNQKYTLGQKVNDGLFDVELPSGATCQARRPGVQGLIAAGLLDSFDDLTALVQTEHIGPKTPRGQIAAAAKVSAKQSQDAAAALMADKDKLASAFQLVDRLVAGIVTQPLVWVDYQFALESDEAFAERTAKALKDEAIAVRDVDLDDKMFLMTWSIGGSSDLAAFREGRDKLMGGLATS